MDSEPEAVPPGLKGSTQFLTDARMRHAGLCDKEKASPGKM